MLHKKTSRILLGFPTAFAVCAFFSLIPLWSTHYPPMVDLPQHVAQVAIWQHLDDPASGFAGHFGLNWFQSYLGFYLLLRFLGLFLPLLLAAKIILSLYVVGLPLSIYWMLKVTDRDPWRSLIGFPLAYGFSYYFGFAPFLMGIPLVFLFVGQVLRFVRVPSTTHAFQMAGLGLLLWLCHLMTLGMALIAGLPLLLFLRPNRRALIVGVSACLPAIILACAYVAHRFLLSERAQYPGVWNWGWHRILEVPFVLFGGVSTWMTITTFVMLVAVVIGLRRPERDWRYGVLWLPALGSLALYLVLPEYVSGTWYVYQRFVLFTLPFVCLLTGEAETGFRAWMVRGALIAVTVGTMLGLLPRLWVFDEDAHEFDVACSEMQAGRRTTGLSFVVLGREDAPPFPLFYHFGVWHQAEKGGLYCYSFAEWPGMFMQLKRESRSGVDESFPAHPERFRWNLHGFSDYYIVRSPTDKGPVLFAGANGQVRLCAHKGWWWLYEKVPTASRAPTSLPPSTDDRRTP